MDNSPTQYAGNAFELQNQTISHHAIVSDREHCPITSNSSPGFSPYEKAEAIIAHMPKPPQIYPHWGNYFGYVPDYDRIEIPYIELHEDKEKYYKGIFHELIHATGHPIRLYRKSLDYGRHNRHAHAMEEMIAEAGAIALCRESDLLDNTLDESLSYIEHWSNYFKNPDQMVFRTACKGKQAANYVLNRIPGKPF